MTYPTFPLLKTTKTIAILCTTALLLFACDATKVESPKNLKQDQEQHTQESKTDDDHDHEPELAKDDHDHPPSDTKAMTLETLPEGVNVVQYEMQHLTQAMQDILLHIANADLAKIPTEISKVHPIYELTHSAIEQGLYKPPANSENILGFAARDDAFHQDLVVLVRAARADDLKAATKAYAKLVEGCTGCHTEFRFAQP